jgi:acyltransferase
MDSRIKWIDAAKGLGIVLVVMSHAPIDETLKAFLFAFHMPLFFYLSGAVFRPHSMSIWAFIKKKARSLLWPYFVFSAASYLIWFSMTRHFPFTAGEDVNPINPFVGIFLSTPGNYQLTYNPAIWFLTCLFVVELLFFLYYRLSKGRFIATFLVVAAIAGYGSTMLSFALPWNVFVALTAVVFYGLGHLTKHFWKTLPWANVLLIATPLFISVFFIQSLNTERVDMRANVLGEFGYFYLAAIAGIAAFLVLIPKLQHSKTLLFLGQNSIVILLIHLPILNFVRAALYYGFQVDLSTANSLPWTLFFTAVTIVLVVPFIYLLQKYPWLLGKAPLKKQGRLQKQHALQGNAVPR